MSDENKPEIHKQDAVTLACNVSQQFITIAIGGVAFMAGASFSTPVSSLLFWLVLAFFGLSIAAGLVLLMYTVNRMNKQIYEVYAIAFRILAFAQIILVMVGIVFLCCVLRPNNTPVDPNMKTIQINLNGQDSIRYPLESDRSYLIECEGGKINFTSQSSVQKD